MDIRNHRFMANVSMTSKIFINKKQKSKSRAALKKELRNQY